MLQQCKSTPGKNSNNLTPVGDCAGERPFIVRGEGEVLFTEGGMGFERGEGSAKWPGGFWGGLCQREPAGVKRT